MQTLLALKSPPTVMVTVRAPSLEPAVNGPRLQDDFAVFEVWTEVWAPLTLTHFVSADVVTFSVTV